MKQQRTSTRRINKTAKGLEYQSEINMSHASTARGRGRGQGRGRTKGRVKEKRMTATGMIAACLNTGGKYIGEW